MKITIHDVARRAGVSTATVSLVLHNKRKISEETRKRVLKAIQELNYHPSQVARGLVLKQTGNIGFVLTEDHFLRTEPFYTRIFLGTEFEARDSNYFVLLSTIPNDFFDDTPLPRFVMQQNVDGIIIAGKVPLKFLDRLSSYNFPLVFVDYYPPRGTYSAVLIDNIRGGMIATDHLIELGHQKIAFIGGDLQHPSISERYLGYKLALEKHSLAYDADLVVTGEQSTSKENGYRAVCALLDKKTEFTALFACNDAMAMGAMECLKKRGIKIPEQVSIVGFDDIEQDAFLDPPLTTIAVPKPELGIEAMKLIQDILNKNIRTNKKVLVPVELVVRKSTTRLRD
ncbi:LacI family DNA-binding transcriptional regulator [Calditrichota bacterium GD2]